MNLSVGEGEATKGGLCDCELGEDKKKKKLRLIGTLVSERAMEVRSW